MLSHRLRDHCRLRGVVLGPMAVGPLVREGGGGDRKADGHGVVDRLNLVLAFSAALEEWHRGESGRVLALAGRGCRLLSLLDHTTRRYSGDAQLKQRLDRFQAKVSLPQPTIRLRHPEKSRRNAHLVGGVRR